VTQAQSLAIPRQALQLTRSIVQSTALSLLKQARLTRSLGQGQSLAITVTPAVPQTVRPDAIATAEQVYAPTVGFTLPAVQPDSIASAAHVYAPTVSVVPRPPAPPLLLWPGIDDPPALVLSVPADAPLLVLGLPSGAPDLVLGVSSAAPALTGRPASGAPPLLLVP
jgi:hypothetical protein